jgi:hypothetical protein
MFNSAGDRKVLIAEVAFSEPRFSQNPNAFDVCIRVTDCNDDAQTEWWRGEYSDDYGRGAVSHLKQSELTMQTLRKLGFEGDDLSELESQIVGIETVAHIKAREYEGKTYYDVQRLGATSINTIDPDEMKRRMQALCGGNGGGKVDMNKQVAAQRSKPAATPNPFAKKAAQAPEAEEDGIPF